MRIIDKIRLSLDSIGDLDYPHAELIVIDNGSNDGSHYEVKKYIEKIRNKIKVKLIRLENNIGFTGGTNVGFRARNKFSKYIVLVNNDAIVEVNSLKRMVEIMESSPELGALQGIIMQPDSIKIDTAGGYITEYLSGYLFRHNEPVTNAKKPIYVSYADGAYSIWRISAIKKVNKGNYMFYDKLFAYCDDIVLGLKLWNYGYKVASYPFVTAIHERGSTFRHLSNIVLYSNIRCLSFLYHISDLTLKSKFLAYLSSARKQARALLKGSPRLFKKMRKAWNEGKKIAKYIIRNEKVKIDIKKVPIIHLNINNIIRFLIATRFVHINHDEVESIYRLES